MWLPAASLATSDSEALDHTRHELADIRKRIAAAKGEANKISDQVKALDRQINRLTAQIGDGGRQIVSLESQIRSTEAGIQDLEKRFKNALAASNARARMLYKSGPARSITPLLSANSIGHFIRMLFWWQMTASLDGKTMIDTARLRADLAERKDDLKKGRKELSSKKASLEGSRELLDSARQDRETALSQVQAQINQEEQELAQLERDSAELTAAIRASNLSRSANGQVSRSGFIWPLNGRVVSPFGPRHGHFHTGIDISGNTGDPIVAAKAGVVAQISCGWGYGICTVIDHGGGVATLYAHQSRRAVTGGSVVTQGEVIGYVGCTGSCSGPHLHFEVRVDGAPQNPLDFLP